MAILASWRLTFLRIFTLLLEVQSAQFEAARDAIAPFAGAHPAG